MAVAVERVQELTGLDSEVLERRGLGGRENRFVQRDGVWYFVRRSRIIGSQWFSYDVYVPCVSIWGHGLDGTEFSARFSDNEDLIYPGNGEAYHNWGEVISQRLPKDLDAIPVGDERIARVGEWRQSLEELTYSLILEAFPEAALGQKSSGSIDLWWS